MALFDDLGSISPQLDSPGKSLLPERCDYTTISTFMTCPRKGFFSHILGWKPAAEYEDKHLHFGKCYHAGLEAGYKFIQDSQKNGQSASSDIIKGISDLAFTTTWDKNPNVAPDDVIAPKTRTNGRELLQRYWSTYARIDQEKEVVDVESLGALELPCKTRYIMKLDLILRDSRGNLEMVEHKTSGWLSQILLTGFEMSYQAEGYLTYLMSLAPSDITCQATYNIAHILKTKMDFLRHPITRSRNLRDRFLWEMNNHVSFIIAENEAAQEEMDIALDMPETYTFSAFARTPGVSCTTYMRACEYKDICFACANPFALGNPPSGFIVRHWDPEKDED